MPSHVEKAIRHERKRKGILVPLIEDFLRKPVNIESDDDVEFLTTLFEKMVQREDRRRTPESKVFSPSSLASCLRQVFLQKHHDDLGIPASLKPRIEPNFYFLTGNFLHLKWQFVLYKMHMKLPDDVFNLVGVEVPILSKRKDHGGTIDVLAQIHGKLYPIDFKGLNVRTFGEITRGVVPPQYAMQVADYMVLLNSSKEIRSLDLIFGDDHGPVFDKALIVSENKGGATIAQPAALVESVVEISDWRRVIQHRLGVLREHEQSNSIPDPECTSTKTIQFQGCPFSAYCREEVKVIERRSAKSGDSEGLRIAIPEGKRNRSTRRNSRG